MNELRGDHLWAGPMFGLLSQQEAFIFAKLNMELTVVMIDICSEPWPEMSYQSMSRCLVGPLPSTIGESDVEDDHAPRETLGRGQLARGREGDLKISNEVSAEASGHESSGAFKVGDKSES